MKLWRLSSQQAVYYSYYRLGFCSKNQHKDLVIRMEQFWNLHDIMRGFHQGSYPLGRGLWLRMTKRGVRMENNQVCFEFHERSWKQYKRSIHWRIHSFLRHGQQHNHHQLHARAASRYSYRHRSRPPFPTRQQTLFRTTTDGGHQNVKRSQSSNISQRLCSDSGTNFSFRSAVNELRNPVSSPKTISSDTNAQNDFEEFSSLCSVGEDDSASSS